MSLTTASPLSQTGLIPCIYRRADFPHRATPDFIASTRGVTITSYTWSCS